MSNNFETIRLAVEEKLEFVKRCGLQLLEASPGRVRCLMPAKGNQNHIGSMYAGALFTLAEIPGGAIWLSTFDIAKSYPILKSFQIDYLKPAKGDIEFSLEIAEDEASRLSSECAEKGKVEFELKGDLIDSNGTVVAQSKGVYQLRRM